MSNKGKDDHTHMSIGTGDGGDDKKKDSLLMADDPSSPSAQSSPAELHFAALPLGFPVTSTAASSSDNTSTATNQHDPSASANLKPIRDESSAFAHVARSCLRISQFAGHGSNTTDASTGGDQPQHLNPTVTSSGLFHDKSYAKIVSDCFAALVQCIQSHRDRKCRIVAARTLALTARSAYARIRHSPLLFTMRDSVLGRLEDEVGSEVPVALLTVALEDGDDGVSASAVEALGMLTLGGAHSAASIDDELLREVQAIAGGRVSPYAPSLRTVLMQARITLTEDPSVAQLELTSRIFGNIMAPRLLQLITRITHYNNVTKDHHRMALPLVTACLIHQLRTTPSRTFGMDQTTYAKRWGDLDAVGLTNDVVSALILPSMQTCLDGALAHTAALCAIRLANASPNAPWGLEVCRWAVVVLKEEISATTVVETKMGTMAALVVALRCLPLPERAPFLEYLVQEVAALPHTTMVPHGVCSPGFLLVQLAQTTSALTVGISNSSIRNLNNQLSSACSEAAPFACYRNPARITYFTELALSLFMDGPTGGENANNNSSNYKVGRGRSDYLKQFLSSGPVVSICKETEKPAVVRMRDEILLVFTTVAWQVGQRFRISPDGSLPMPPARKQQYSSPEVEEWTRLAFTTLSIFSPCARWGRRPDYLEEDLTLLTAGQSSYIRLLQEFLHFAGLLHRMSSVTFKLTPNACPPHLLWDQMTESASFLTRWHHAMTNSSGHGNATTATCLSSCSDGMIQDIAALMDDFVEKDLRQGIISHHMRLFLLTLASDQWVQGRVVAIRKQLDDPAPEGAIHVSLNRDSARDLLVALSPKRLLTKLLEYHSVAVDAQGRKKKDPIKKLALETVRVCVACVENIALTASEWKRRFGASPESQTIVNMAIASLQGTLDKSPTDESLKPVLGPLCDAGIESIQSFYHDGSGNQSGVDGFPVSNLVAQVMRYKIKPLVAGSSAKISDRDVIANHEYLTGYLMQLSRQMISSRVDMCLYSAPTADPAFSCYARARNWLRTSVPPLPDSRDARGRRFRGKGEQKVSAWGHNVTSVSAGSDPISVILAHSLTRIPRYDNEEEYRLTFAMQLTNCTAVEVPDGFRLELGLVYQRHESAMDSASLEFMSALGGVAEDLQPETAPLMSAMATYKQAVNAGDHLTWEVTMEHLPAGEIVVYPTVVFRNIPEEPTYAVKVGGQSDRDSKSTPLKAPQSENLSGEDDFQVSTKEKGAGFSGDQMDSENVCLAGDPIELSPLLGLQPCPLVFFRDAWGDLATFQFLWFRMPDAVPPIKTAPSDSAQGAFGDVTDVGSQQDIIGRNVAESSSLLFDGEAIPGGVATHLWAMMSLTGQRVMAVMTETEEGVVELHLRADSSPLLYTLVGSKEARKLVVSALVPHLRAVE